MKRTNPARMVPVAFALAIAVGAVVLWLPISHAPGQSTSFLDALFTAVSATCVTGLTTLDTATHWSTFGKVVILVLIQIGGIKVGTFFLLAYVIWSEVTGQDEVRVGHRRVGAQTIRQALTVVLLAIGLIALSTYIILSATHFRLDVVLFECISAFATVGLSANLTPLMPPIGKIVLMVLMFCGRVGPITVVAAMTVRTRTYKHHLPEERPLVG